MVKKVFEFQTSFYIEKIDFICTYDIICSGGHGYGVQSNKVSR